MPVTKWLLASGKRRSPSHKRNMLRPFWTEIGVGVSGAFWTQNFGREPYDEDHDAED